MRFRRRGRLAVAAGAGLLVLMLVSAVSAGAHSELRGGISRGPSTTTDPYVIPVTEGVHVKSLLTVGDAGAAGNGYEMTGIPDGLGARKTSGHGLFLNMN